MALKTTPQAGPASSRRHFLILLACLLAVMAAVFHKVLLPDWMLFNNDGPLGANARAAAKLPEIFTGMWVDSNWLGGGQPAAAPDLTMNFMWLLGPLLFAKFWSPASLVILGLCAWLFFRELKLAPLACVLGGLLAALHPDPFGNACWGQVSRPLALSASFLALAALQTSPGWRVWIKVILAGMAVGLGIMESFDIGAIFSLFVAAYVLFQALVTGDGATGKRLGLGVARVVLVAGFAAFIAAQTLVGLVGTQVKGVAGAQQDQQTKEQHWDWATQWSIPKKEALGFLIPGVFGYRMLGIGPDPGDGSYYWGTTGQTPGWEQHHQGAARYGGGGPSSGVLVFTIIAWALWRSLQKQDSPFTPGQRKFIWFWAGVAFVCLLLAFGRHAPFYKFFYALPYASTIRNPAKFIHVFDWALMILFAYGVHGLVRCYLEKPVVPAGTKAGPLEIKWLLGSGLAVALSVVGWVIYAGSQRALEAYLQTVAFDAEMATQIARFSIRSVAVFVVLLAVAVGLVRLIVRGKFAGGNAKFGGILLGLFLALDLIRADLPSVLTQNWKVKYETNSVIEFLRARPYEQRVNIFPLDRFVDFRRLPRELAPLAQAYSSFAQLYGIEWVQHLFLYYNIQTLDIIQESRVAADKAAFEAVMAFSPVRRWELTNTRYLIGPALIRDLFNQQIDPAQKRLRIAAQFDLAAKPGADGDRGLEQMTTIMNTNGQFAVFDFTGALPRAKLFSNWKVSTNDAAALSEWVKQIEPRVPAEMGAALAAQGPTDLATLKELADPAFDPAQTLLLAEPLPPPGGTNQAPGEVKFESYAPKHIVLKAQTAAPVVLLLNDRYDPNWQVTVDGQPAKLLRCNFIMRGVYLDKPGPHQIEFKFLPSTTGLYVSLSGLALGLLLVGYVSFSKPGEDNAMPVEDPNPKNSSPKQAGFGN